MLAIWRLATIIDHQAATWPTHDPTWYGPISIILAVLEVDCAAICASIPIFWPVLEARWGTIFITQEIKITREDRRLEEEAAVAESAAAVGGSDRDYYHSYLQHHQHQQHNYHGSRGSGSELELNLKRSESNRSLGGTHYNDIPTLGQVRTAAVIESDAARDAGGKRWGF
ncbi:hypothetical protein PFICI_02057 [Pestalotiopsis fici W106-1]|uniref:Integral membrane protein n=1 Tax=Pestalotiopsis fici (strain W106-1 / CGMCC3.15140) TaxID=1229662 RepID=W3XQH1_PESFW|nr:uncharacterized protein PFICI_02057 [Pestalotiopsis fici W106-1]ETS88229.1 hypothetical protein PFICI_02057 [Pestalotiopsis fici W106-1]